MANSVDPDETPHSAASHLGLQCLLKPVSPNTYGKYSKVCDTLYQCLHLYSKTRPRTSWHFNLEVQQNEN